ncbi:hypothetical protein Aple_048760 [Acrocarpospora pleiomorpha]|uniref:Uncharacterized protein n=1 Tax=Acrocarpospora pleiomorpha TaxID=90975 RepID=A0A5M3XPD6_9ACTN|nr:hypothetical protein [Acrocarpospora pleiomorpha]GES21979.1 hypothetical protein Aple_048760 [Acrocarpospora pleiomorpha]
MAEFMGMDPAGVHALIRRLESGKSILAGIRPGLEAAIAEAGADWAGAGGITAMHRAWAFFHDSQADLRWRLEVLQQVLPDRPLGLTTVSLPFVSQEQAAAAGKRAGMTLADALAAHQTEDTPQSWAKVDAALAAAGLDETRDPAYAAAFLRALGGVETVHTIFGKWMDFHTAGPRRGLRAEIWATAQESLGALATAFTAAEASDRLPAGWRENVLARADPATLSAIVALARPSGPFLNEVGVRQFGSRATGSAPLMMGPDWNSVLVARAYTANPGALQKLLAEHEEIAGKLLRPQLVKGTGTSEFPALLATALGRALDSGIGSAATRERAWINLINAVGYDGTENPSGHFASFENSPINKALAKNLTPYLGELARGQIYADSPELGLVPSGPWKDLHEDVAARFVGALMQDPETAKTLQSDFHAYVRGLDIGQAHPFSSDPAERADYTRLSAEAGGLSNLLLGGSTYAEFNDDEFNDLIADAALLPVTFGLNRLFKDASPLDSTAVDYYTNGPKDAVGDLLKGRLDAGTPETAGVVAERIIDFEVRELEKSLSRHGHDALTLEDREQLWQAFRGRLYPALVKALEARGG